MEQSRIDWPSFVACAVIIAVDAVAIGEIGPISNAYLGKVRSTIRPC